MASARAKKKGKRYLLIFEGRELLTGKEDEQINDLSERHFDALLRQMIRIRRRRRGESSFPFDTV